MTKYGNYNKPTKSLKERMELHPIWRGIGLILAVVIPVMSYLLVAYVLQNESQFPWLAIPSELVVRQLWDPYVLIKFLYTLVLVLVIFMVIAFFTFVINSLFSPRHR